MSYGFRAWRGGAGGGVAAEAVEGTGCAGAGGVAGVADGEPGCRGGGFCGLRVYGGTGCPCGRGGVCCGCPYGRR
ncbi:hypothetical protein DB35_26145 [Streptomyces abyssalis]|nr:hypothetical protein DB35_26145 [Streptomyces abyssalis]